MDGCRFMSGGGEGESMCDCDCSSSWNPGYMRVSQLRAGFGHGVLWSCVFFCGLCLRLCLCLGSKSGSGSGSGSGVAWVGLG